jgi:hypothetical protein
MPLIDTIEAVRTFDAPSVNSGSASGTVNSRPVTLVLNFSSKCFSAISPRDANLAPPALVNRASAGPCSS